MKRKHVLRIALALGLVVVALGFVAIAVLHSRAFHQFALALISKKASQATGGQVEIRDFDIRWSRLLVDFDHVVLHGSEAASLPPLLQVDRIRVGMKIVSLWHRKVDLEEIVIDRPSIHLSVDPQGHSNLPTPPAKPGASSTNVFDLALGFLAVNQGELDYNDRKTPLEAEIHGLQTQVTFDSAQTTYTGTLAYPAGRIQMAGFHPIQHGVQVQFEATPAGLNINSLVLNAASSTISVEARLRNYNNPSVEGSYQATLATGEIGRIVNAAAIPTGLLTLQGTLQFQNRANQPFLESFSTSGTFLSPVLALRLPQAHADLRALSGEYELEEGTLVVRRVKAGVLGGAMTGDVTLAHLSERPVARVSAAVTDISLEAASATMNAQELERAGISGTVNGILNGSWEGKGDNLQVHCDATIAATAPAGSGTPGSTNAIPLHGALHADYNGKTGAIALHNTELATPHLTLDLNGSTGKQSSLGIKAESDDLRELDQIALMVRRAMGTGVRSSAAPVEPLGIGGSASFAGQLEGSVVDPHLAGRLSSNRLQYRGTTLSELRLNVALSPSNASVSQGVLRIEAGGQMQFEAAESLKHWSYTPQSPLRLNLTAAGLPVGALVQLANLHYPVTGTLGVHVTLNGSQSNPVGQGSVTLAHATAWEQPIQNLSVQFQSAGTNVHSTLQVSTPAGSASGEISYDFHSQGYQARLNLPDIQIEKLEALKNKDMQMKGEVAVSCEGSGTLKDPRLTLTVRAPNLLIGKQTIDGLALNADVAHQQATFTLDSAARGASIQARGTLGLNADYPAQATLDVRNIQLGSLLAAFLPQIPPDLAGQAELHGSLHGPLKQREQIEAEVEIPKVNLTYKNLEIGNASPIRAAYRGGVISLESCELKGTGTDLQAQATIPIEGTRNLIAEATGKVDLHLVQLLYSDWDTSGQLSLALNAEGALPHPTVKGTVRLVDAAFETPQAPLGVQNVNATLAINNDRVDIQSFRGEAGGGTLSAQGFAVYRPALQFNMALSAEKVRLRYPVGTRAILDGKLALTGSGDSALLSGQVLVDRLSLTKEFDLSTFMDQFSGSSAAPSAGFAQNVKLNVSLKSASDMALANSQLSLQGSANLMVRGTAADPVILGRSDITGGDIFFNGNRYVVENGVVQFVNPVQTEPVVNMVVTTTINQFNLTMNFVGPIDRMRTTYTSDPPLAPLDIINLLATGQTTEATSTGTNPESVVAGQLTSQLSNRVQKLAGISSLTIDPNVGGAQGNGGGRLAVQQRVTRNLFFTFSTDLTSSTGAIVQVEYQATKRFAVSTIRDQNGGYSVEVKMHKRF